MEAESSTYRERVMRIAHMLDVRTAFESEASIQQAKALLKQHAQQQQAAPGSVESPEVARARRLVAATVHPDTGDIVRPAALRLSCLVPANMTVDALMLSARTIPTIVGAQWINQTYNALHYYANRNATNTDTSLQRWLAYFGATGSSVAAALGATRWGDRLAARHASLSPAVIDAAPPLKRFFLRNGATIAKRGAPMMAVASADLLNIFTMRCSEYIHGVNVYASVGGGEMEKVGNSRLAGLYAVSACTFSRVVVAVPVLSIPPAIMVGLERTAWLAANPWARMPLLLAAVGTCIMIGVPLVFGVFRQTAECHVKWLEPRFHALTDSRGNPVTYVRYNKGL